MPSYLLRFLVRLTGIMKKILIIDDNDMFRFILAEWLKTEGYHPLMAKDGLEGIQLAKSHLPALIFCDVKMPVLNGIEVRKQLRNDLTTSHIPFFFITSESSLRPSLLQQLEVSGVILKGADIDQLRQALITIEVKELT